MQDLGNGCPDGRRCRCRATIFLNNRFGRPGKGNDNGKAEGLAGFVRRNFMTPLRAAGDFDAFNARLRDARAMRRRAVLRGRGTAIALRMQADLAAFMKLPATKLPPGFSSLPLVRCKKTIGPLSAPRGYNASRAHALAKLTETKRDGCRRALYGCLRLICEFGEPPGRANRYDVVVLSVNRKNRDMHCVSEGQFNLSCLITAMTSQPGQR